MARSTHQPTAPTASSVVSGVDVAVGASALALGAAVRLARRVGSALEPVGRAAMRPPGVPARLQPTRWVEVVGDIGSQRRTSIRRELVRRLDSLVPAVLAEVLQRAHLTDMVLRYVDLDEVVAAVDLDSAAARLDVDSVVRRADVDAVVDRVDVEAILDRLDLTSVVLERVDLDAVLAAVLDRLDLTAVVLERVDLAAVVDEALAKVDLVGIAEDVIDGVDLPEIIRESTGSMASDTVRGVRMQGIVADEAVGRAVDRLLLRRGRRPSPPAEEALPTAAPPGEAKIPSQSDPRP